MRFSPKEIEALLEALSKAGKELRPKLGDLSVERVKVGKSEVKVFCKIENVEGTRRVLVKYDGSKIWVEGPRWASLPLKNRLVRLLQVNK